MSNKTPRTPVAGATLDNRLRDPEDEGNEMPGAREAHQTSGIMMDIIQEEGSNDESSSSSSASTVMEPTVARAMIAGITPISAHHQHFEEQQTEMSDRSLWS